MKRLYSFHAKCINAMIAVVSLALITSQSVHAVGLPSPGKGAARAVETSTVNSLFAQSKPMSNEARALDSFTKTLSSFAEQSETLGRKPKVKPTEIHLLKTSAESLKRTIPSAQSALRTIISKLKSKGKWTDDLDAVAIDQIKHSADLEPQAKQELINALENSGGARKAMEQSLLRLTTFRQEIDNDVNRFQSNRIGTQLWFTPQVHAVAFNPTSPVLFKTGNRWLDFIGCHVAQFLCLIFC